MSDFQKKFAALGLIFAVVAVAGYFYFSKDSDTKAIARMLDSLARAIEQDDLDGVLSHIMPNAEKTKGLARANMALVKISSVKYDNLKIEYDTMMSRPTAIVTFNAVIYWSTKVPIEGFMFDNARPELVKFKVELEKVADDPKGGIWKITNQCEFSPTATGK